MGIRSKIKKRLPIFGKKTPPQATKPPTSSQPSYTPPVFEEPKSARGDTPVEDFIQNLVSENKVVLFMKGSPQQPLCGFSANAAGIHRPSWMAPGPRTQLQAASRKLQASSF